MKFNLKQLFILTISICFFINCTTDDLDPTIAQAKPIEGGITKVENLSSLMRGVHSSLTSSGYYGRNLIATNAVRSDNCFSNGNSGRFTTAGEYVYNANSGFIWNNAYSIIVNLNVILATDITTLEGNQNVAQHIQGQAHTLRALVHYDLLRSYGQQNSDGTLGVVIQTQYTGSGSADLYLPRNTIDEVKAFIYEELNKGYALMNSSYDSKVLISKMAAKAIESRVAIYFGDWTRARDAAQTVVNSGQFSIVTAADFVSSWAQDANSNSIFELEYSLADNLGGNSLAYIYRFPGDAPSGYGDIEVVSDIVNLFEATDVRGINNGEGILGYQNSGSVLRNMGKYPDTTNGSDNIPLIRYEEIILNLAEALFELNNSDPVALEHLNSIPSNRGASNYTSTTKSNILLERRKELMFEGFRFDDLMRTSSSINVIGSSQNIITTLTYPNNLFAWPIPNSEMDTNSNMTQNSGY